MKLRASCLVLVFFALLPNAWAQSPRVGYVYPAGGQCGTSFLVEVGGQGLRAVDGVHVTGDGVRAEVADHAWALNNDQQRAAQSLLREVVHPVTTPNGIGLSPDGKVVYYAETEGARLWAIDVAGPDGAIVAHPFPALGGGARFVAQAGGAYTRFDSLKVDSAGHVVVATLFNGGLSRIDPQTGSISHTPLPDRYVTNLCFAGADLKTVYVTLSSQGKLIAIDDWPVAGLRLNNQ